MLLSGGRHPDTSVGGRRPPAPPAVPAEVRGHHLYLLISALFLVQIVDGLDVLSLAFVGPAISRELPLSRTQLGACIGIAFFGMALGAMFFGWVAGRAGKKRTLVVILALMVPAALATGRVGGPGPLFTLRLLTGFALGGIFPVAAALLLERVGAAIRTTAVSLISAGSSCGAIACGFVASLVVPAFGWRSMFVAIGLLALALIPAVAWVVPRDGARASAAPMPFVASGGARGRSTIWGSHLPATLLLWSASFFGALAAFFMIGWLPTLAKAAGSTTAGSAFVASLFTTMGALGGILAARMVDRFGLRIVPVVAVAAAVAAAALGGAIGSPFQSVASAVAGFLVLGLLTLAGAVSGQIYPPAVRAFGVGCGIAAMRLGATVGPWAGGLALDAGFSNALLFTVAGLFVLVGGFCLWRLRFAAAVPDASVERS